MEEFRKELKTDKIFIGLCIFIARNKIIEM